MISPPNNLSTSESKIRHSKSIFKWPQRFPFLLLFLHNSRTTVLLLYLILVRTFFCFWKTINLNKFSENLSCFLMASFYSIKLGRLAHWFDLSKRKDLDWFWSRNLDQLWTFQVHKGRFRIWTSDCSSSAQLLSWHSNNFVIFESLESRPLNKQIMAFFESNFIYNSKDFREVQIN